MKRLTDITKRDIFDMLIDRHTNEMELYVYQPNMNSSWYHGDNEAERVFHFYGRINVIEFLSRLYDLEKLPSYNDKKMLKKIFYNISFGIMITVNIGCFSKTGLN